MMSVMKQFEHLKIPLEAIKSATNNFAEDNCIGKGGFGKVYKGDLFHSKGKTVVALKRLDRAFGQGNPEFWKEITMLSLYRHENIVSLLGFCDESGEKILVYEYASKSSLDKFLKNCDLTWNRRLKICIGAARGLGYLHNPAGTQQRVLHRDIKSSNILLDENWNARISDLGLSKFGPANQQYTFLVSNAVGTIGYCDPLYVETGLLTKESDVYSFGVVLFEILCGRLCIDTTNGAHRSLTELVRQCYEQNKMNEIIFGDIKDKINPKSLKAFISISFQCLKRNREERPSMAEIVKSLEGSLKYQTDPEEHLSITGIRSLTTALGYLEVEFGLIGIQDAGKTSLVNAVTTGEFSEIVNSTVGFVLRKVTKGNTNLKIWDLGGRPRFRSMWERYCHHNSAIVFVVDAADEDNLPISKSELDDLLTKPSLSDIPLLVLGNKIDKDGALTKEAFTDKMALSSITNREVCCFMISCKNSQNIDSVIEWLVRHPKQKS